jgi:TfoX/Sxy family transcriptional regulator of competence genes
LIVPRSDEKSKELFRSLLPEDARMAIRPMFGNISAFVNGNMFAGLFGNDIFVRLSDKSRQELLGEKGASYLEPMKGKADEGVRSRPLCLEEQAGDNPSMAGQIAELDQHVATEND